MSAGRQSKAAAGTSFLPSVSAGRETKTDDMDFGFTFPASNGPGHANTVNIQDLVRPLPHSTFLDLTDGSRRNGSQHNRSKTEPAPSRSLFATRLFTGHRDVSHHTGAHISVFRHSQKAHMKSASMSASPAISAPFGLSIAAYRPVPTHSTAARVSRSLQKPDLKSLDPSNAVLLPAGPSHMQKQVEDLETRRTMTGPNKRYGENGSRAGAQQFPSNADSHPNAPRYTPVQSEPRSGLRPVVAISDAQVSRGGSDQPVNWMRTGLSRSASQEAVQMLQPTRWEARNGCEQLVLPRPKLVAHEASPPATPEQVQRERAFFPAYKGKETARPPSGDILVIDRPKFGVTFDQQRTSSPALSGFRVMDEGAERERERQAWARSISSGRKRSTRRPRSNSLGTGDRGPRDDGSVQNLGNTYFALPGPPGSGPGPVLQNASPPISTSFGFLHGNGSLRSRSRSATGSSRKAGSNSPRQFGSTSTGVQSFRNEPHQYGSNSRASEDSFAAPIPRTPSQHQGRLSRIHSSPDLRQASDPSPDWSIPNHQPATSEFADGDLLRRTHPRTARPTTPPWFGARNARSSHHGREHADVPPEVQSQRLTGDKEARARYFKLSEAQSYGPERSDSPARVPLTRRANSPDRSTVNSPSAEPLPAHTARALASRLSNSPRRMKSSIEEAVNRARSSAVLLYGEDPESFAKYEHMHLADAGASQPMTSRDRLEILEAAGILPQ